MSKWDNKPSGKKEENIENSICFFMQSYNFSPTFLWEPRKSLIPPFHSPLVSIASASPEKRAGRHYASSPSSSHAVFLRSAGLLHPQYGFIHFSPQAPLHYIQQYYVCRPQFFQRLLLRTAIGVCSIITLHLDKERPEKGAYFLVTPPFHAHTRFVSLRASAILPRLWWQFDCRNPATALFEK